MDKPEVDWSYDDEIETLENNNSENERQACRDGVITERERVLDILFDPANEVPEFCLRRIAPLIAEGRR